MRVIGVILGLVVYATASGQSVEELDKKGGFKEFKIGDSVSLYKDKVKPTKTLENVDSKLYLAKDKVSVKTYTGEVELKVYKGKVQEVIVSFKNSSKSDFEDLLKSLETLYGEYSKGKEKSPALSRFEKVYVWTGQKIKLRIGYDENYKLTEMVYSEHDSVDKLKEEF
ncbi:MAG TPA: hypothetical protein VK508_06790 [Cyclobacteriaceae bacterium]|nr:hypothetical protein [Cyclobacteriaceae bacterium]